MNEVAKGKESTSPGQSLVEMALVLVILVLILAGLADLGRALNAYIVITNAAREGARYGAGHPTDQEGIQAHAIAEAAGSGIDLTSNDIEITSSESGQPVTVSVTYEVTVIFLSIFGGSSIPVTGSATMVAF